MPRLFADRSRLVVTRFSLLMAGLAGTVFASAAQAAPAPGGLGLRLENIREGEAIPAMHAHCIPQKTGRTGNGGDVSPGVFWRVGPAGTKSYALVMHDTDVPADFTDANQEGRTIPAEAARRPAFYHWLLVDIPPRMNALRQGDESTNAREIFAPGATRNGLRLANSFGMMDGPAHGGYDGPCPPWNDVKLHHYHFTLYALDVPTLGLPVNADGDAVLKALDGHVLAYETVTATYTQNPSLR